MLFKWFSRLSLFSKLSHTAVVMCAVECIQFICLLALGVSTAVFIYPFERPAAYAVGLFIGCLISLLKIIMLEKTIARAVELGNQAKNYATLQAVLRYFGTIAAIVPAFIFRNQIGVFGVVAGLLSLQVSAFITSGIIKKDKRV